MQNEEWNTEAEDDMVDAEIAMSVAICQSDMVWLIP